MSTLPTSLSGTEAFTVELDGRLPIPTARRFVPDALALEERDGEVVASLLLFHMTRLSFDALGWPRFSYGEALWRIGVELGSEPAWFGVRCDLDDPLVRFFGGRFVRYPVARARFSFGESRVEVDAAAGRLRLSLETSDEDPAIVPPRRIVVTSGGRLAEIPGGRGARPPGGARRAFTSTRTR